MFLFWNVGASNHESFFTNVFRWRLSASKRICKGQRHCWRFLKVFGLHVANQVEHFQMVMWRMLSKQKLHWSLTISWSHEMVCAKFCIMVRATCSIKLNTSTSRQVATAGLTSSSWNLCWGVHLFVSWMCQTTTISETRGERCAKVTKLPEHKTPNPSQNPGRRRTPVPANQIPGILHGLGGTQ